MSHLATPPLSFSYLFVAWLRSYVEDTRHRHITSGQAATVRNSHAAGGLMAIHLSGMSQAGGPEVTPTEVQDTAVLDGRRSLTLLRVGGL